MSILSTESFIAFGKTTGDDSYSTDNTNIRNAFLAAFKRAGYYADASTQASAQNSGAFVIRPDPIYPDRNALVFSNGNTTGTSAGAMTNIAMLRKPIPQQGKPIIGGFSLYVPPEYVPNVYNTSQQPVLYFMCTNSAYTSRATPSSGQIAFIISSDLVVRPSAGAAQSTKALVPGRQSFIEYRISDNEVKVWIDDVLVLQYAASMTLDQIGFLITQNSNTAPNTFLQGAAGRWAIGNWYNLAEDAQAPNVRLGPTTRVIGVRPTTDVDVHFSRPAGPTSNAAVAGQDIVDAPTYSLQSSTVGDQDIYSTTSDSATASGALIHAVTTKVLASNLESNQHTIRPLVISSGGVEREDAKPKQFVSLVSPFTKNMYGVARRPTDGKAFASGYGPCLFATSTGNANANSTWNQIADEGSSTVYGVVGFRSNGLGVIARSDFKLQIIPVGSDTPGAVFNGPTAATYIPYCITVLPDDTILVGCAGGRVWRCPAASDPSVTANWSLITVAASGAIGGIVYSTALNRAVACVSGTTSTYTSDDKGATWTVRAAGMATSVSVASPGQTQLSFDGTWFTMMLQNTTSANYIKRSADGIAWSAMTYNTNSSTGGVINFMFAGQVTGVTLATNTGNMLSSADGGANWRNQSVFTSAAIYAACELPNGDWFMVGNGGGLYAYTSSQVDVPLVPLAGYQMTYNATTTNPDTNAAWTPAEAAATKFGMRITS